MREFNKQIFKEFFNLSYNKCFENPKFPPTEGYDVVKIIDLIKRTIKFKRNGNSFQGFRTRYRFYLLHRILNEIHSKLSFDKWITHGWTDEYCTIKFCEKYKSDLKQAKKHYRKLYRLIFNYLK